MKVMIALLIIVILMYAAVKRTKKKKLMNAAYNILLAQFTFYNEDVETQNLVFDRARKILLGRTTEKFANDVFDVEPNPLVVFGFYALAMDELDIKPALYGFDSWYEVANPFVVEIGIKDELRKATKAIEAKTNVCYDHWVS